MVKLNENTNVSLPIRNLIALVAAVAIGVWAYFGIVERLNKLETSDTLFQADLLKKAEQEPKNLEMYMLIEHLAGQIESIEKEIEASRYNKVNIDHLKEQVDVLQKQIQPNMSECLRGKRIANRNASPSTEYRCIISKAETEIYMGEKSIKKLILDQE